MHLNKLNCLHWTGLSSKATLLRLHSSPLSLSFQHRFVAETKWIYSKFHLSVFRRKIVAEIKYSYFEILLS